MNRRKEEPRSHTSVIFALILAAAIMAAGGVLHAYYKNRQIQVSREIDAIEKNVEHCRFDIRTTEMRMDQLLNRFVIRKQLEQNKSKLRPISLAVVEDVDATPPTRRNVAVVSP